MRTLPLIIATLTLAACEHSGQDQLRIASARVGATPPGATVAAAYMTVTSSRGDTLIAASTPVAERVEMHESVQEDGMMRMRPLQKAEVPRGGALSFAPGGAHFMLVGLRSPLAAGSTVPMTLHFANAGERQVQLEVVPPGSDAAH